MKIVFIGQKGIPAVSGGVEKHVANLSVSLAAKGHEVLVYTRSNYTNKDLKEYNGVKLFSLPSIHTKHLDAISHTFLACLDLIFRQRKVDIVHFHSIGPSSLIWLVKLFRPGLPVVATFHTQCYFHKKWNNFARLYLKFGEASLCRLSDQIITVSKSLQQYVLGKYGRLAVYCPNGVNMPKSLPAQGIKNNWGLERDSYFLIVSRLIEHKGIHYAIEAYKKLKTNKKLVITGDGFFTPNYVWQLKKSAGNNKNIIFTGAQSGKILEELYSNAYLFIQPSESEGLSLSLLEAMSYSLGVLVSDIRENKEGIGKTGFVFKNKDSRDLARQLEYLLFHPKEVKEKGRQARERIEKKYNWQNIANDILEVYFKTLKRRNGLVKKFA